MEERLTDAEMRVLENAAGKLNKLDWWILAVAHSRDEISAAQCPEYFAAKDIRTTSTLKEISDSLEKLTVMGYFKKRDDSYSPTPEGRRLGKYIDR